MSFDNVEQMLDGLEKTAGRAARPSTCLPLDIAGLRAEWAAMKKQVKTIHGVDLPSADAVWSSWKELQREAAAQQRSVFEMSSLMALSAVRWVGEAFGDSRRAPDGQDRAKFPSRSL